MLCWEADTGYVPPFQISPRQFTIGVRYAQPTAPVVPVVLPNRLVPAGVAYDLEATLHQAGIAEAPDLIVVWGSAWRANVPINLGAFRSPRLLICGDTHHMPRPISSVIEYARAGAFDAIASVYDRHHLHWFTWLPGISVQVSFVGQISDMHPGARLCWSASRRQAFHCAPARRRERRRQICTRGRLHRSMAAWTAI